VNDQELEREILRFAKAIPPGAEGHARDVFDQLIDRLNSGTVRSASRDAAGVWHVNAWVKAGILLGFRLGRLIEQSGLGPLKFFDKDTGIITQLNSGQP